MKEFEERLASHPARLIETTVIESWFPEYAGCVRHVLDAVRRGLLEPVKRSGSNGRIPSLASKFRILQTTPVGAGTLKHTLLTLPVPLDPKFYAAHPARYSDDYYIISCISSYIRKKDHSEIVRIPANERSFELFGNEKTLLEKGDAVLRRLGVTLDILDCYRTSEPFVFFSYVQAPRTVLISENRDPFSSLNDVFRTNRRRLGPHLVDALIYGEGRRILSSIAFSLEILNPDPSSLHFLYWGDLDAEGIAILLDLRRARPDWRIEPAMPLYEAMMARMPSTPPLTRSGRTFEIDPFFDLLPPGIAENAYQLVYSGRYLPQEAVPLTVLRRLAQPL